MISVVIIAELLVEYTAALAKLTAGLLPRRQGQSDVVRIGGFYLPCPSPSSTNRSSPIPDFSSHLVDFWSLDDVLKNEFWFGFPPLSDLIEELRLRFFHLVCISSVSLPLDFESLRAFVNLYRNIIENYFFFIYSLIFHLPNFWSCSLLASRLDFA